MTGKTAFFFDLFFALQNIGLSVLKNRIYLKISLF
jgi:hypothetical protein